MSELIIGLLIVAGISAFLILVAVACAILANVFIDFYLDWRDRR